MKIQKIYIGGWFQRTTLHLSEIYDFLKEAYSPLLPDKDKIKNLRDNLGLKTVEMKIDNLEYVDITTDNDLEIKIYEDGLIILNKMPGAEIKSDVKELNSFYEDKLSPALNYIFSLGALVPKELEKVQTIHPYFIILDKATKDDVKRLLEQFNQNKYFEITNDSFEIYRGDKLYIINNIKEKLSTLERFIQEHIFIREFKGQMHRYLNIHRVIWEKVAEVKGKGEIKGKDIPSFKDKLESYSETVTLIEARINQMSTYIRTRKSIVKNDEELNKFVQFLQFKYETLYDTLEYLREIWRMTKNYVNSGIELLSGIQAESTKHSIKNLVVITSMGVGATLLRLLTKEVPQLTWFGVVYFLILIVIGYAANEITKAIYRRRTYKIEDVKAAEDIQKMVDF